MAMVLGNATFLQIIKSVSNWVSVCPCLMLFVDERALKAAWRLCRFCSAWSHTRSILQRKPKPVDSEHCQTHGCCACEQPAAPHGQAGAGLPEHNRQKAGCGSKASGGGLQARPVRCRHCAYATSHERLNVTVLLVCEITQAV